jgi:hypothetical protein
MTEINSNINFKNDPPLYDLQEVIQQYQSQPELLKLILTSKVEEDKRRAEEAKLRAKELDLYFQHKEKKSYKMLPSISSTLKRSRSSSSPYVIPPLSQTQQTSSSSAAYRSYHSSISSTSSSSGSVSSLSELEEEEEEEGREEEGEEEEEVQMDHQQRRHSAAAAMLAMGGAAMSNAITTGETISNAYPSPIDEHYGDDKEETTTEEDEDMNKPRRRREMQAITKIVETREFPYVDNYFWKNNGNTVQKKTGCKSIYYKCSNSNKVRLFLNGIWRGEVGLAGLPVIHLIGLVDI